MPPIAPQYPPAPQPIADSKGGFRVTREWLLFFATLAQQAAAGAGAASNPGLAGMAFVMDGATEGGSDGPFGPLGVPGAPGASGAAGPMGPPGVEGEPGEDSQIWVLPSSSGSGITQLTGDVTAGPGSGSQAATLAASGVTAGTYGDSTHVGQFTVNAKGLITAASSVAISASGGAAYAPATDGHEAPAVIDNGAGELVMVPYTA